MFIGRILDVDIHEIEGITGKGRSALWLLSGQLGLRTGIR